MEDPRIRKFAQFLIRSAVGLERGEKILIELHGSETGQIGRASCRERV